MRFDWKRARRSLAACRRPVFLDLGDNRVLRLPEQFAPREEMTGALYTRASVENWLRDGAQLERIIPPPEVLTVAPPIPVGLAVRRLAGSAPTRPASPSPRPSRRQTADRPVRQWVMNEDWLSATLRIVPEVGMEACETLRRVVIEKYRAGELALPDA